MTTQIAYLVHDLKDAAVARRVRMLTAGGAAVVVGGFSRGTPPATVANVSAMLLGHTRDARLMQRILAVLRNVVHTNRAYQLVDNADVLVARNLEMLVIAARVRKRQQRLVYECLDIHRLMLGNGIASYALRWLERRLLRRCDLIITSSPSFIEEYFHSVQHHIGRIKLVENKVLAIEDRAVSNDSMSYTLGAPWRIGWFGMLRCSKTLSMLSEIARTSNGQVEVLIAGRPAYTEFNDFDRDVSETPGLRYVGPYTPSDLADLYSQVDFVWSVDFFEEGLNSRWLLPNRLYEGLAFGAVPVSVPDIAISKWLQAHGVGVLFEDLVAEFPRFLQTLDDRSMNRLRQAVKSVPRDQLIASRADCLSLVAAMTVPA